VILKRITIQFHNMTKACNWRVLNSDTEKLYNYLDKPFLILLEYFLFKTDILAITYISFFFVDEDLNLILSRLKTTGMKRFKQDIYYEKQKPYCSFLNFRTNWRINNFKKHDKTWTIVTLQDLSIQYLFHYW
jgi:hypothetical protein